MPKKLELVGRKFGRLTVIRFDHSNNVSFWECLCDCGKTIITRGSSLTNNLTKSCGCLKTEKSVEHGKICKHGGAKRGLTLPEYKVWIGMRKRCNNPMEKIYPFYGGRGIKVCEGWGNSFSNFYKDVGKRKDNQTLDRIDNDMNYSCGKCRECKEKGWIKNVKWATRTEQARNRRSNYLLTMNNETKTLAEWSEITGINRKTISDRINKHGWSIKDALTIPVQKHTMQTH